MGVGCLTFDYNMFGFHMGSLRIVTITPEGEVGATQWALSGPQGPAWKTAQTQIQLAQGEQVRTPRHPLSKPLLRLGRSCKCTSLQCILYFTKC